MSFLLAMPLRAQVSPGPLSLSHESLNTPLKCPSCHEFGAGAPKFKCLDCHREIDARINARRGFHGRLPEAATHSIQCSKCHPEHLGPDFDISQRPTSHKNFNHADAGYPLVGKHAGLACGKCHQAARIPPNEARLIKVKDKNTTYLGLSTSCVACHQDKHEGRFGTDCSRCHTPARWKPAINFNHSETRYPLTGKHAGVDCAKCHKPDSTGTAQYRGIAFEDCATCHKDPHGNTLRQPCAACHTTAGWKGSVISPLFDHGATKYPLLGKHATVTCQKCHKSSNFSQPVAHAQCLDCHRDAHSGQFTGRADRGECKACHTENGFKPSTFVAASHDTTAFPLKEKHAHVECAKCHPGRGELARYRVAHAACLDCHRDIHEGQFSASPRLNRCEGCHTESKFKPSTFTLAKHAQSSFPLRSSHAGVPCGDCHTKSGEGPARYHFPSLQCETCHRDPHGGHYEFLAKAATRSEGSRCIACHELRSWKALIPFDHAITGYALTGSHRYTSCLQCHRPSQNTASQREITFTKTPTDCAGCHQDPHGGQFSRDGRQRECESCHVPVRWYTAQFNHDETRFPLDGAHRNVPCRLCHKEDRQDEIRLIQYRGTPKECAACHSKI